MGKRRKKNSEVDSKDKRIADLEQQLSQAMAIILDYLV
jgi:hypothetical protein